MTDVAAAVEIPARALFKAAEVCDLLKVQPYVLKTWEAEFPTLGVAKTAGGPRVYRRQDVEQVLRIRQLLLVEGLTLAGARRKIEEDSAPIAPDVAGLDQLLGKNARERVAEVRQGLRSLLDLLGGRLAASELKRTPARTAGSARAESAVSGSRRQTVEVKKHGKASPARPVHSPRRKRSA